MLNLFYRLLFNISEPPHPKKMILSGPVCIGRDVGETEEIYENL